MSHLVYMTHCVTLGLSLHLSGPIFTGNSDSHLGDTTQQLTRASGSVARGQPAGYESFPRGLDSLDSGESTCPKIHKGSSQVFSW